MAAWGYGFYLLVLKVSLTRSLRSLGRDTFTTGRIKFVSPRGHVISSIYLKRKKVGLASRHIFFKYTTLFQLCSNL